LVTLKITLCEEANLEQTSNNCWRPLAEGGKYNCIVSKQQTIYKFMAYYYYYYSGCHGKWPSNDCRMLCCIGSDRPGRSAWFSGEFGALLFSYRARTNRQQRFFCGVYAPHEGAVVTLYCEMIILLASAVRLLQLRFDGHSTTIRLFFKGH